MKVIDKKLKFLFSVSITVLFFNSCILDEFKFDEIQMKEEWSIDIVSPLFHANLEFKDLVHDWGTLVFQSGEQTSFLKFPENSLIEIPTRIIFEPATIIDSFNFLINGNYSLLNVNLEYTVSNGCPFPLNFQMRFFEKTNPLQLGPPVLPPPFLSANFDGVDYIPVETTHIITLTEQQLQSFSNSNRVEFTTWFNTSELINTTDTFLSNYPVEILIVLHGEVQQGNEN